MLSLFGATYAQKTETDRMLDRFLSYARIGSQSVEDLVNEDSFPVTDGQKQIASVIYNEIISIKGVEVKMSPDYYIYAKISSNMKRQVPSVAFMVHMDCTPEAPGDKEGLTVNPQIHRNYQGGDIEVGHGVVLKADSPQGTHLKDFIGKTIVTSDGSTLLGADCKAGCAILVTMMEEMSNNKKFKHGDVYFFFTQNEETGKVASRIDLSYLDKVPDILIDVDGNDYGEFSLENFTAVNRAYLFKGNQAHPSNGKVLGYADARTAMAYFIGQLPPSIHPSNSEGKQGYVHCYAINQLENMHDVELLFRIRYFDKSDSVIYAKHLDKALQNTMRAYPNVGIEMQKTFTQYDNVAYRMHPNTQEVILKATQQTGIPMRPTSLRAGTTCALMVAKGLPGGSCIYGGQQAVHSVYEWCCIEELVDLTSLCMNIVKEVSKLAK